MLNVDSRPQGATVFLEGRDIGKTPLNLGTGSNLAVGSYRMWVELGKAKSIPQPITVGESAVPIVIDLAFEGALWAEGPGLHPLEGNAIDEDVAKKIGRFLGVDTLLLVGKSYDNGQEWLFGYAFEVAEGTTARRGSVKVGGDVTIANAAANLAAFLGRGDREGVDVNRALPASVLPQRRASVAGNSTSSPSLTVSSTQAPAEIEIPWVPIGVVTGAVLAAAAVAAGIVAIIALSPQDGSAVVLVKSIDDK